MANVSEIKLAERVCRHCGAPISGAPYAREHGGYGCESCYLADRRQRALPPEIDEIQFALAEALVCALDAREHETGMHSRRVACHTLVLAKHFTEDSRQLRQVYWGALLHDIGKVGIPDAILLKQGSLTDHEWQVMRTHPEIGHRILASVPLMAQAADLVLNHEERFDGTGYPRGLAGAAIPLWARLFAVIDTLDAVTSDRPYRSALGFDAACAEITAHAGTQFDPLVLDVFRAEQATLRTMVELKCGTVEVRDLLPAEARPA
jgi:HD-GYP domain-containing protein (c-di-GMP phosphodiesterase class II)